MARKVFISFLGGTNYHYCDYWKENKSYGNVRFIQEATLNFLQVKNEWTKKDVAMILLTKGAEESNWVDNGQKDKNGHIISDERTNDTLEGLETRLKSYPITINPIRDLPDGNKENEIWTIFERIFEQIQEYDELYFDITHGFRYLPMLVLVLCNYSNFLKKVNVKSITYGNYEAHRELGHGLIVNLLPLSQLQDWTYAAGQYLDSGNVKKLIDLKTSIKSDVLKSIVDKLETVIKERQTCRGLQIHKSENLSTLKNELSDFIDGEDVSPEDEPLHQILKKVDASLEEFSASSNFMNGFQAAKWCVKNGLFQQAITMLRENFITLFCERHGFSLMDKDMRFIVETALNIQINHSQNRKDKWPVDLSNAQLIADIEVILQDEWIRTDGKHNNELVHVYQEIRDYRNNFNHAGFNENSPSPQEIETKVNEFVERTFSCFNNMRNNQ